MEADLQRDRLLNQELAHLVAYAFHEPDNMPDFTKKAAPVSEADQIELGRQALWAFATAQNASGKNTTKLVKR